MTPTKAIFDQEWVCTNIFTWARVVTLEKAQILFYRAPTGDK
jgi:hypothetical protein